jgi:hypothetical protein
MPAWANSKIFQQAMLSPLGRAFAGAGGSAATGFASLSADTIDVALFNGTTAPDNTAVVASTGFNTGVWITANEVISTNWPTGGVPLTGKTFALDSGSSSACFQAAYTTPTPPVTLTTFFGCLVYDATISAGTVAKQGLCFNYFGGTQTITGGAFTIQWATVGGIVSPNGVVFNITI